MRRKSRVPYRVLYLYFSCRTRKEVRIEIYEVVSFHHPQAKFVTLQELHINDTQSLIRDSNKISEHLQVIKK